MFLYNYAVEVFAVGVLLLGVIYTEVVDYVAAHRASGPAAGAGEVPATRKAA